VAVGAAVALHSHRPDIGQKHHRALPDLVVQAGRGQLLAGDRVGTAQGVQPIGGHLTDDSDAEAGTREGLARNDFLWQAELTAHRAHLVLEQQPQRLDEFELQVAGQPTDVVMALDVGGPAAAAGLDHVGVQRALHQVFNVGIAGAQRVSHGALERADELAADDLALALRVGHSGQRLEEPVLSVDSHQPGPGGRDEITLHLGTFAGAQQTVVDEHARQPVADGPLHQRCGHRGVNPAGQPADRPAVTDLVAHLFNQRIGDVRGRPCCADAGEFVQEPTQYLLAVRRMQHLWVVLHTRQPAAPILEGRDRSAGTGRHHVEPLRGGGDRVTVAHPHRLGGGQIGMELSPSHFQFSTAILAGPGVGNGAAQRLRHRLEPVADAEHRHPEVEQRGIQLRCAVGIHAGRTAGKHDGLRVLGLDLLDAGGVRDDLRIHSRLADPSRDQLRVLRAEVDHQDGAGRC
jgi:hypothetical protein